MTPTALAPLRRAALALLLGAGGAVALLLGAGTGAGGVAFLLVALAATAAVVAPWRVAAAPGEASGPARALHATAEVAALLAGALLAAAVVARSGLGGALLGGGAWLLGFAALLAALAAAAGRAGQAVATAAGLLLLAAPYALGPALVDLDAAGRQAALDRVLLTPVPVLAGSFAGVDVLRGEVLYAGFPLGQTTPYAYAAPGAALGALVAALAAVGAALGAATARARRLAPAGALLLLLLLPGRAEAQLIETPAGTDGSGEIGGLQTRVQLGYWVADLRGKSKLDGFNNAQEGSNLSFRRVLELDPIFVLPTFEVHLSWANAGRVSVQYLEAGWDGETQTAVGRNIEEVFIEPGNILDTRYRFRSIALAGELHIPILDFATLRLMATTRYVYHWQKVRAFPKGASVKNRVEGLIPVLGAGVDVYVWDMITIYGDMQWLDFRTSLFGGGDEQYEFGYREWRLGVRLELVEHAWIMLEWFHLETKVIEGGAEEYEQRLGGPRLQVAILF